MSNYIEKLLIWDSSFLFETVEELSKSIKDIYKPNLHININEIYDNLNKYNGIDTTELEDVSSKNNVFLFF